MTNPRVSILLPVYNAAADLSRALNSLRAQTLTDFEVIAINDGSSDASGGILDDYARREPRLRVFHQGNAGALGQVLNRAAELAAGKYLARHDADDASSPQRLEQQVHYLETHPQSGLCATWAWFIDAKYGPMFSYEPPDNHNRLAHYMESGQNPLVHGSVMMRADLFQQMGGYRGSYVEDFDLWLRISEKARLGMVTSLGYYYWRSVGGINTGAYLRQRALIQLVLRLHQERTARKREVTNWDKAYAEILTQHPVQTHPAEREASMHYARAIYLLRMGRWQEYKRELEQSLQEQGPYAQKARRNLKLFWAAPLLRLGYRLAQTREPFRYSRPLQPGTTLPEF